VKLSILVVSYNVRELLGRCLASVAEHEVVVVDNASQDGTADMVRGSFPQVKLVAWGENKGFSAAVNEAARNATGDVFLLLNPDAELPSGATRRMLSALANRPDAVAMGFRQVDGQGHFQLAMGLKPTLLVELGRKLVQNRLDRGDVALGNLLDRVSNAGPVAWVAGSALLVRRCAFEEIGGFDERFFLYFEDIDFCLRLTQTGGRVYYDPFITVVHHRGQSAKKAQSAASRAYRDSQLYFWEKHRGPWVRRLVQTYLMARKLAPRQLTAFGSLR
jgi:GT2 family glycosyltransferase